MAITTTPRFGFKQYGAGTDAHPNRDEFNALLLLIENNAALFSQNTTALRPTAGKAGRYFWDSTVARLYYDDGAAWQEVTTNGGGGAGKPVVPNTAGVEGTSSRSARADHTHNLALATASADGAMSAADKALLNTASATPTANSIVKLDAAGRAQVAAPAAAGDIANKTYVDAQRDTRATTAHTHVAADVTSGTFDPARLPNVTSVANGAMTAADKVILDAATSAATAGQLVERDAAGRAQFADPIALADAVTKGYFDTQLATKSANGHTHDYASITGKPTIFATNWASIANIPATMPSTWATVSGKPTVFASDWASITNIPATFASTWALVAGKPTTFAPSGHTHLWGDLTDKPTSFSPAVHTHAWADITTGKPAWIGAAKPSYNADEVVTLAGASNVQTDLNYLSTRVNDAHTRCDSLDNNKLNKFDFTYRVGGDGVHSSFHSPNAQHFIAAHDNGYIWSPTIFNSNAATGSYRAMWINNNGVMGYNLSSRKYKQHERDYVVPLDLLKTVSPQWFKYTHDIEELGVDAAPERVNFIAEDLHDAGLKEYVSYNDDEQTRESAETINEQLMVNALWSFAQQQQELIEGMRKELDELKAGK